MSYEESKSYFPCKCGNPKGVMQVNFSNEWNQHEEGWPQIICKECNSKYFFTRKYYCKHPGDEGYSYTWNEKKINNKE